MNDLIDRQAVLGLPRNITRNLFGEIVEESINVEEIEALPPAQTELQEGHWIPHETPDGGEQYECSECGVLWEFNDGTPEDNEAYFCPKCGAKMKGARPK